MRPGETILEAGLRAGFWLPFACRNGNCERCAGTLLAGTVRLRQGGTVEAGGDGADTVLYCAAHPLSNCEIDVTGTTAPGRLPERELACQISAIEPLNHDVSRVWLRLPAGTTLRWHAGQYLMLRLAQGDCPFSIANACLNETRELELHVRHNSENPASLEVMEELRNNAVVTILGPGGERFIGEELPGQPVWFVCGSTGFAPAKAMIEALLARGFDREIRLYWGARTSDDLYLSALPEQWASDGRVTYHPVLSEDSGGATRTGLVHQAAIEDLHEPEAPLFHVGGSPAMAWAVFDALCAAGVPGERIHSDVFDYAPRE